MWQRFLDFYRSKYVSLFSKIYVHKFWWSNLLCFIFQETVWSLEQLRLVNDASKRLVNVTCTRRNWFYEVRRHPVNFFRKKRRIPLQKFQNFMCKIKISWMKLIFICESANSHVKFMFRTPTFHLQNYEPIRFKCELGISYVKTFPFHKWNENFISENVSIPYVCQICNDMWNFRSWIKFSPQIYFKVLGYQINYCLECLILLFDHVNLCFVWSKRRGE